jgi:ribonucleoside-diphosphate reductase alpha chain
MGYKKSQIDDIVNYIDTEKTIIGAPHLKDEHLPVFACSMGDNAIHYMGHVKMMGAVQPFLSGAISKTVNLPEEASVEDIEQLHIESWKLGLKAVAVYRDNCKVGQPLSMAKKDGDKKDEPVGAASAAVTSTIDDKIVVKGAVRRKLPQVRNSRTYRFAVADLKGYFTVSEFEDGTPGEVFVNISKQGSTLSGLMDSFAISMSHGLQYGVPLKSYVKTLRGTTFAPSGMTDDADIRTATSITDYIMRRLALDYLSFDDRLELGLASIDDMPELQTTLIEEKPAQAAEQPKQEKVEVAEVKASAPKAAGKDDTAPMCFNCGNQTQRSGSCYVCTSCGSTTGCS